MYYPKSKILENQFTNGKEFVMTKNNKPYIGYYFSIADKEFWTGKTSDNPKKEQLIKVESPSKVKPNLTYNKVSKNSTDGFIQPAPYYPKPTEEDYKIGFVTRYFMKRRTDDYTKIVEISPDDYEANFESATDGLDTSMYVAVKINWKITGPKNNDNSDPNFPKPGIIETNQKLVKLKEKLFPGFSLFITDYSKFSK